MTEQEIEMLHAADDAQDRIQRQVSKWREGQEQECADLAKRLHDVQDRHLDIVFETSSEPGAAGAFVEVERDGRSVRAGKWIHRPDGLVALRLTPRDFGPGEAASTSEEFAAIKLPRPPLKLRPPTPDQRWLRLGAADDSGMILISEISTVFRLCEEDTSMGKKWPPTMLDRGVEIILKSGQHVSAPDAVYSEVKLALYAAGVGA